MNQDQDHARARQDAETLRHAAKWAEEVRDNDPIHRVDQGVQNALSQMADGCRALADQIRITRRPMTVTYEQSRDSYAAQAAAPESERGQTTSTREGGVYRTLTDGDGNLVDVEITPPPLVNAVSLHQLATAEATMSRVVDNWSMIADSHGGPWSDGSHHATLAMVGTLATLPGPLLATLLASAIGTIGRTRVDDTPNTSGDAPA